MSNRPNILVVADEPKNLTAIERALKGTDAEIVKAGSGNDALSACRNHEFALAILDVKMPDMDGYELAEHMRGEERVQGVPIIFVIETQSEQKTGFRGCDAGAVDFLQKPFNEKVLLSKVGVFLQLHKQAGKVKELQARERSLRELAEMAPESFFEGEDRDILFNASMDMLCIAGFDGSLKRINPAWRKVLGWSEEEMTSKPWLEFVHPDDREATISSTKRGTHTGWTTTSRRDSPRLERSWA